MNYFNEEQIEELLPYENYFYTIIKAKYKRATQSRVNETVANVYEEATGEVVQRNWSCAQCIYSLFEKCGKLYYESLKKLNEEKLKEEKLKEEKLKEEAEKKKSKKSKKE